MVKILIMLMIIIIRAMIIIKIRPSKDECSTSDQTLILGLQTLGCLDV